MVMCFCKILSLMVTQVKASIYSNILKPTEIETEKMLSLETKNTEKNTKSESQIIP